MNRIMVSLSIVVLCCVHAMPVPAQDAGLYGKEVDRSASFVRLVGLETQESVIAGNPVLPVGGVSPYVYVDAGEVEVTSGNRSAVVDVEPGKYYSLAMTAAGNVVFNDPVKDDPAKAQVYLYNLSDLPTIDLFVPAAKVIAVQGVPPGASRDVSLRAPLALSFEIHRDGRKIAEIASVDLKRRSGYTIVLSGTGGSYSSIAIENTLLQH